MGRVFVIGPKVDLDTCGAAFVLGFNPKVDEVKVVLSSQASKEDLANPDVICIEVGGSGRVAEGNFDHHDSDGPASSAIWQAAVSIFGQRPRCQDVDACDEGSKKCTGRKPAYSYCYLYGENCFFLRDEILYNMILYIDEIDIHGPDRSREFGSPLMGYFPFLSDVFAGMLLLEPDPKRQFIHGVYILSKVYKCNLKADEVMPQLPEWDAWIQAKQKNDGELRRALQDAVWDQTSSGLRLGILETRYIGAPGTLYGAGAQVVVALNPDLKGIRKFTVAGNDIRVDAVLPLLQKLETGWGGPATGTIVGSPRDRDSKLSLEQVVQIVKETL